MLPALAPMAFDNEIHPERSSTQRVLPHNQPDHTRVTFDDRHSVANAALILPVTLPHDLGLSQLVDHHVDLGAAQGRANPTTLFVPHIKEPIQ